MKQSLIVLAALACLAVAESGNASEQRFYMGADVAAVLPTVDKSDGINFGLPTGSVHVPPESIRFDGSEFGWSALFGYRVNSYLSAEVAYLDFGSIDVAETFDLANALPVPVEPGEFTFDFDLRVYGPMVSVLGTLPFAGKYEAFARAGVLWASQEVPLAPQFKLTNEDELWALGLGLRAQLGGGWSARLEYQRFDDMPGTESPATFGWSGCCWVQPTISEVPAIRRREPAHIRMAYKPDFMRLQISESRNPPSEKATAS